MPPILAGFLLLLPSVFLLVLLSSVFLLASADALRPEAYSVTR
jgi:hypothetical protein